MWLGKRDVVRDEVTLLNLNVHQEILNWQQKNSFIKKLLLRFKVLNFRLMRLDELAKYI